METILAADFETKMLCAAIVQWGGVDLGNDIHPEELHYHIPADSEAAIVEGSQTHFGAKRAEIIDLPMAFVRRAHLVVRNPQPGPLDSFLTYQEFPLAVMVVNGKKLSFWKWEESILGA